MFPQVLEGPDGTLEVRAGGLHAFRSGARFCSTELAMEGPDIVKDAYYFKTNVCQRAHNVGEEIFPGKLFQFYFFDQAG